MFSITSGWEHCQSSLQQPGWAFFPWLCKEMPEVDDSPVIAQPFPYSSPCPSLLSPSLLVCTKFARVKQSCLFLGCLSQSVPSEVMNNSDFRCFSQTSFSIWLLIHTSSECDHYQNVIITLSPSSPEPNTHREVLECVLCRENWLRLKIPCGSVFLLKISF